MGALVEVRENGFVLEAEGRRLWVTLKEKAGSYEEFRKHVKMCMCGDETVENWMLIWKYSVEINEVLVEGGYSYLSGEYWTSDVITTGEEPMARTIELPEGYLDEYPTRFSAFFRGIKELE